MRFRDRNEAGQKLAAALSKYKGGDVVVYAMPRGGVPLGIAVAEFLSSPLDLVIVRKVGHPFSPEYAVCAVTEAGERLCNEEEVKALPKEQLEKIFAAEILEAGRRRKAYLGDRDRISPAGKTAIVVDDGVATGLTLRLALKEIKKGKPKLLVAAVPVIPKETAEIIKKESDELVALDIPDIYLGAVGAYYDEFPQLSDDEVRNLLDASAVPDKNKKNR